MPKQGRGTWFLVLCLLALLALATWFAVSGWSSAGDSPAGGVTGEVTGLGYGAMALGILATLGLGVGLMLLVYRSERR